MSWTYSAFYFLKWKCSLLVERIILQEKRSNFRLKLSQFECKWILIQYFINSWNALFFPTTWLWCCFIYIINKNTAAWSFWKMYECSTDSHPIYTEVISMWKIGEVYDTHDCITCPLIQLPGSYSNIPNSWAASNTCHWREENKKRKIWQLNASHFPLL